MSQVRVRAADNGVPAKTDVTLVTVTIRRNFNSPVFVAENYTASIPETTPLGTSVVQVNATDSDNEV